jgi:hypothetical protein
MSEGSVWYTAFPHRRCEEEDCWRQTRGSTPRVRMDHLWTPFFLCRLAEVPTVCSRTFRPQCNVHPASCNCNLRSFKVNSSLTGMLQGTTAQPSEVSHSARNRTWCRVPGLPTCGVEGDRWRQTGFDSPCPNIGRLVGCLFFSHIEFRCFCTVEKES